MSDLHSKFLEFYPVLKEELLNDPAFEYDDASRQWVERVNSHFPSFYLLFCFDFLFCVLFFSFYCDGCFVLLLVAVAGVLFVFVSLSLAVFDMDLNGIFFFGGYVIVEKKYQWISQIWNCLV